MNLASPWAVQIAMLPLRRPDPNETSQRRYDSQREAALVMARKRAALAHNQIAAILRKGPADGMTADEIACTSKASGNMYRHLGAMAAAGRIEKRRAGRNVVRWVLAS
jgi:hypothetical protein